MMQKSILESSSDLLGKIKNESYTKMGSWDVDMVNSEIFWSTETKEIHEVPADYKCNLEEAFSFFKDEKSRELLSTSFKQAIETNNRYDVTVKLTTHQGSLKWVRTIGIPVFNGEKCIRVYGVIQDVTDAIQLESIKSKQKEFFETTFHEASIGMGVVNLDGRFIMVNKALCKMLGYKQDQLIQLTFKDITHPDDLGTSISSFKGFKEGKIKKYETEKRYIKKNGNALHALLSISIVNDDDGYPMLFIVQITDISGRVKAENKAKKLLEVTTDQNKRLLNFAHIVSHNLRSHSGNISMLLDLFQYEQQQLKDNEMLSYLKKAVGELSETISHLNEVVQAHTTNRTNIAAINLHEHIEKTIRVLSGVIMDSNAVINNNTAPEITVNYIPAYLESVLLNLIGNAIKYKSPERTPVIELNTYVTEGSPVLVIKDNGLGIDLDRHGNQLFGMYKTFHHHEDSRGVGLFLTKNQIESMRGTIEVESEVNKGTTFKIYFSNEAS